MGWKLAWAVAAPLLYFNMLVLFSELAARTVSLSLHVAGSAFLALLVVLALFLAARLEVHPAAASLLVPVGGCLGYAASQRSAPPVLPALLVALPLFLLTIALVRGLRATPSTTAVVVMLVAVPIVMTGAILLERYLEAREVAALEAERAAFVELQREKIRTLRAAVANGARDKACALFAEDDARTAADFALCRASVEAETDDAERWRQIGSFFPAYAARRMLPIGTPDERQWALRAYAHAWTELPDAEVLKWNGYVREALWQVKGETARALEPELRTQMIERLETCLHAPDLNPDEETQARGTIAFLKTLE